MRKTLTIGLLSIVAAAALSSAPAFAAGPAVFRAEQGGALLRSASTLPSKGQPDAIEFNNETNVTFTLKYLPNKLEKEEEVKALVCTEFELGTAVATNQLEGVEENTLALPWGVAEGESCAEGAVPAVPTYFDTNSKGVVPATITFMKTTPEHALATVHKLKMSYVNSGKFCTAVFEGMKGNVVDSKGPFSSLTEEGPPNTYIEFKNALFEGSCEGKPVRKFRGEFNAKFFVETMSTLTDTVWIE
jgi:hypothetical protein